MRLTEWLTPERTRRRTTLERYTVGRLSWRRCVMLNSYLEFTGKICTCVWGVFIGSVVLGFDWKKVAEHAINSGKPVKGAIVLAIVVPTLLFVAARSLIGFARWRLQRELWRREVDHVEDRDGLTST